MHALILMIVFSGPVKVDAYALARASLRLKMPRTATVLTQELAYRVQDTPGARQAFRQLESEVPPDLREPHYALGYLWPHTTRGTAVSPYEAERTRLEQQAGGNRAAVDLKPLWTLRASADSCISALEEDRGARSGLIDPKQSSRYESVTLTEFVELALRVCEEWDENRLLAALILDLGEGGHRDADEALRRIEVSSVYRGRKCQNLPPGCDTHDISWKAFQRAMTYPACTMEISFEELTRRVKVLLGEGRPSQSKEETVMRRLEMPFEEYHAGGASLADALGLLLDWAGAEDASDWEGLRRLGFDRQSAVYTDVWSWEHLPARVVLGRLLFESYGGRLGWRVNAAGAISICATPGCAE